MWKVSNRHPTSCYCWSDVVCLPLICKHLTRFLRVGAFVFIFNYILTNICSKTSFCFHLQSNERKWQKVNTGFLQYFKSKGVPKYIFDVIYLIRKKLEMFNPQTGGWKDKTYIYPVGVWVRVLTSVSSVFPDSADVSLGRLQRLCFEYSSTSWPSWLLLYHSQPPWFELYSMSKSVCRCCLVQDQEIFFLFFVHWMFICNNIQKTFLHPKVTVAAE